MYRNNDTSLDINLLLCSISRIITVGSHLRPMICLVTVLDHGINFSCELTCEMALKPN